MALEHHSQRLVDVVNRVVALVGVYSYYGILTLENSTAGGIYILTDPESAQGVLNIMYGEDPTIMRCVHSFLQDAIDAHDHLEEAGQSTYDIVLPGRFIGSNSVEQPLALLTLWFLKVREGGVDTSQSRQAHTRLRDELQRLKDIYDKFDKTRTSGYRAAVNKVRAQLDKSRRDIPIQYITAFHALHRYPRQIAEALAVQAAAEAGLRPVTDAALRQVFNLLRPTPGRNRRVLLARNVPRILWNHLLPRVVSWRGYTYRGTLTGDRWLRIAGLTGGRAGLHTELRDLVSGDELLPHSHIAMEVDRVTLHPTQADLDTFLLQWTVQGGMLHRCYQDLSNTVARGERAFGRSTAEVWKRLLEETTLRWPGHAKETVSMALTQRSLVAVHAASRSYSDFKWGVIMRVVGTLGDDGVIVGTGRLRIQIDRGSDSVEVNLIDTTCNTDNLHRGYMDTLTDMIVAYYDEGGASVIRMVNGEVVGPRRPPRYPDFVHRAAVWKGVDSLRCRYRVHHATTA